MPNPPQSPAEIGAFMDRLDGQQISSLEVLGINSLKSIEPSPVDLAGQVITGFEVSDRIFTIFTKDYSVTVDLQRTGKIVWLSRASPRTIVGSSARPTARILLADGSGVDLTEPAKTKRIQIFLQRRTP